MENKEKEINKAAEALTKELETMNNESLHDFFIIFYRLNHQHYNMICPDKFDEFLEAFDSNPFKVNEDKAFKKQLIDIIIKYDFHFLHFTTSSDKSEYKTIVYLLTSNTRINPIYVYMSQ